MRGHIGIALAAPQCLSTRSRRRCSSPARPRSAASRSGTAAGRRRAAAVMDGLLAARRMAGARRCSSPTIAASLSSIRRRRWRRSFRRSGRWTSAHASSPSTTGTAGSWRPSACRSRDGCRRSSGTSTGAATSRAPRSSCRWLISLVLIALILALVDGDGGRYVRGQGGGMNIIDDRRGGRPAGTEAWITSGLIDPGKPLPLSILERQTCYFIFSEPATMCHNIFLATEAMGIGGWMHCGFLSLELMRALGFRMVEGAAGSYPNPVGCDGVLEGFCPPYHRDMDAAVDAALESLAGGRTAAMQPHAMVEEAYRAAILDVPSAAGIACAKSVCRYIYETYGRFPASVDAMHLMWFMQAHHLDVGYYRCHYVPDALSPRHAEHMAVWHGEQSPC